MPRKKRFFGRGGIYNDGTSLPESIVCAVGANLVHSQEAQISGQYPTVASRPLRTMGVRNSSVFQKGFLLGLGRDIGHIERLVGPGFGVDQSRKANFLLDGLVLPGR